MRAEMRMKVIIIGGFLGSGKTTTLLSLGKHLVENGRKIAIIVNEVGEVGVDGETLSLGGVPTKELTGGCICCTMLDSMKKTLEIIMSEYGPDTLIIEPTGLAFPFQIKAGIEEMNIEGVNFAPVVTLVDASVMYEDMQKVPNFVVNQVEESEIVCINKIDLVDTKAIASVANTILDINLNATIAEFSAKNWDAKFQAVLDLLAGESKVMYKSEHLNSTEMSGVGSYAGGYMLKADGLHSEKVMTMLGHMLVGVKEELKEKNPDFIGHVKMTFMFDRGLVKANLTSAYGDPYVETMEEAEEDEQHLKFLSAITQVSRDELIEIVDGSIQKMLSDEGIGFEKIGVKGHSHSHSHEPVIITL